MSLTENQRRNFIIIFMLLFYLLAAYKWWQGMWLYQFNPFFFRLKFDGISWIFMQTGLHIWLMKKLWVQLVFDAIFYGIPACYAVLYFLNKQKLLPIFALFWFIFNWIYVLAYTQFATNSIEAHTGWLLFPILFGAKSLRSFYLLMHGLRYFFIFFFFSAGVWKLVNGGAFEIGQMSGILLDQHATFLVSDPAHWHAHLLYWLIEMPVTGFLLYWVAIFIELSFGIGFFSRRFDKVLILFFILFLGFDYLVMRIPYFEVSPYLITLLFSRYGLPKKG
jgi:hypothetical protein